MVLIILFKDNLSYWGFNFVLCMTCKSTVFHKLKDCKSNYKDISVKQVINSYSCESLTIGYL